MSFVYPGFLFALSALAIPIIIHLIQLRKYKKIYFSNISFLQSLEKQQRNTNRLKHLLVLLARLLTILFLVLAFAQPFIGADATKQLAGKNYVSIYVDNSFSMDRQAKEGTLLNEAKRKAKEIVMAYKPNDEFQLLSNEFSGYQQRWLNREQFLQNLAELKIKPEVRSLKEVANRQTSLLKDKQSQQSTAFVISDFQQSFIEGSQQSDFDSSVQWQMMLLESNRNYNMSIDSVWFYSPLHFPGSEEVLLVKLKNHSSDDVENVPYDIVLNDDVIGVGNANVQAESFVIDTFKFKNRSTGPQAGYVKLKDQSLAFDNEFFFAYQVEKSRNIAIINGSNASTFVEEVYRTEPFFNIKTFNYLQVDFAYLNSCDVIVLNEVDEYSSGLLSEMEKALQLKKVIVSIPSSKPGLKVNTFNQRFGLAIQSEMVKKSERIENINFNSNLFKELFIGKRNKRLDLPNMSAYYPFEKSSQIAEPMMMLSNSQSVLNRYTLNAGVIYQFAMPLQTTFSDLPKHSLIVPMFLRIGTIHHSADDIAYTIGSSKAIPLSNISINEKTNKELSKGDYSFIPEIRNVDGQTKMYVADQIKEAGIYNFNVEKQLKAKYAFNTDRKESDMRLANEQQLEDILPNDAKVWEPKSASISNVLKQEQMGQRLWKICVILALFFIALEIVLLKYGDKLLQQKTNTP